MDDLKNHSLQKRIVVVGHYGSGKTEFSLNLAFRLREQGEKVTIVDLDVVNPYFRTADAVNELKAQGIRVIAPEYANTNVDVPALPPDIFAAFETDGTVIFDVGGDDDGAIVLGRFFSRFQEAPYDMLGVVNTRRPLTGTQEEIVQGLRDIEAVSRLRFTGLVNNTNLTYETTSEIVEESLPLVEGAAGEMGLPVRFVCAERRIAEKLQPGADLFPLDRKLKQW